MNRLQWKQTRPSYSFTAANKQQGSKHSNNKHLGETLQFLLRESVCNLSAVGWERFPDRTSTKNSSRPAVCSWTWYEQKCWHVFTGASSYLSREALCQPLNLSSWFSASSDPLWEPVALCCQTPHLKTHQVSDFPSHFIEFTLWHFEPRNSLEKAAGWGGWCGENNEASQNFSKTASPPKRHNASLWRLNVADCVCGRIWKEEGGEAGRMWCLKSTWLW